MPLDLSPDDLFREGGRWLVRLALWLAVVTSLLTLPSAVLAQQTPPDPAATTIQFDARFVPRDQRKPVPYELAGRTAVIRVSVNGQEVWALLDNLSSSTLIDEAFARSLGLQLTPVTGRLFTTTGALQRSRVTELVDLAIPGQVGMRAPVFAADLSGWSAVAGRPISLIVGKEYFDVMLFVFSPGHRKVQLGPSGSLRVAADTPYLALRDDSPQIEVMIAGRPVALTIDLVTTARSRSASTRGAGWG